MTAGRYIVSSFVLLALALSVLFSYNYIIDPFNINNVYREYGFNKLKPDFWSKTRTLKVFNSIDVNPETIFLGSSRLEYLTPDENYAQYSDKKCYNLSLSGGTVCEEEKMFNFAMDQFDLSEIYYEADFYSITDHFDDYIEGFDIDLVEGRKSLLLEECKMYLTWYGKERSDYCIELNERDPNGNTVYYQYNHLGSRTNAWRYLQLELKGEERLDAQIQEYVEYYVRLYNAPERVLEENKMKSFRALLDGLNSKVQKSVVFTPPLYADQYKILVASSCYPLYITYLETMVKGSCSFVYFGGVNEMTENKELYWDSHHARKDMMKYIGPYIFSDDGEKRNDLWGKRFNSSNLSILLDELAKDRDLYMGLDFIKKDEQD